MPSGPKSLPWSNAAAPDLLSQAVAVLAREATRLPGASGSGMPKAPSAAGLTCPVVGARSPAAGEPTADLRQQAHELLAGLFSAFGQPSALPNGYATPAYSPELKAPSGQACPITKATPPPLGFDKDALRRQAHEFIDTLLVTFRATTSEDGVVAENKVPLLQCAAPAPAGGVARATLIVANEEPTPTQVTLYCSNFVSDTGHEIPALRVSFSPRVATISSNGQVRFEIKIAVPPQAPASTYSGLIQAMGSKYVKAVLSVEVL